MSTHGLRCGGVAMTAASLTIADRLVVVVDDDDRAGTASSACLIASASGVLAGTEMARRARRRACSAGSRSRNLVALMDWVAPVHMNAAMTTTHSMLTMSPPARPPEKNGIASSADAPGPGPPRRRRWWPRPAAR